MISNKALVVPPKFGMMKQDERVAAIAELLNSPKMVYINIVPDHHYIVEPINVDKVAILQGFQGVYNLIEWMENRGLGVMRKDEFIADMGDLVGANAGKRTKAAVKLFSYSLAKNADAADEDGKRCKPKLKSITARPPASPPAPPKTCKARASLDSARGLVLGHAAG